MIACSFDYYAPARFRYTTHPQVALEHFQRKDNIFRYLKPIVTTNFEVNRPSKTKSGDDALRATPLIRKRTDNLGVTLPRTKNKIETPKNSRMIIDEVHRILIKTIKKNKGNTELGIT